MRQLPVVVLVVACSGPDDEGKDNTDTDTGPPSFVFKETVEARSFQAEVSEDAIAAHRVSSTLLAATGVVVADEKVQDRLNVDGGGAGVRAAQLDCWSRPQFPQFSFAMDFTGCDAFGMQGGVYVEDHPSGPVLFTFQDFAFEVDNISRILGGTLALDRNGAFPDAMYWKTYNTDPDDPPYPEPEGGVPAPRVQIGVSLDRTLYGVSYVGGSSIDFLNQTWSSWGVLTTGTPENPITIVHGARTPEEVAPDEPTGADVLKTSLNWLACRCPTSGISTYDMPLHFTSVNVDLDDLEDEPDDVDDPEVALQVDYDMFGKGVLTHQPACGEYTVDYETETLSVPVTTDRLVAGMSFLCDTLVIPDRPRCDAFVRAAQALPNGLTISVTEGDADQTALLAVEDSFDTSWCVLD